MKLEEQKKIFNQNNIIYESVKLKFTGVDGFDVYNPSIPFYWDGKRYIYGRVEKREYWARSCVRLFEEIGKDEWSLVPDSMIYQLEDPYISIINNQLVLGGTHVRKRQQNIDTYYSYFYKGTDIDDLAYFTTGPDHMKDIRLVELQDKRIGVFSRPRSSKIKEMYGSDSIIGFTTIDTLDDLNDEVINSALKIDNLFEAGEWGGCNQCYALDSGMIGVIGHKSYERILENGEKLLSYLNFSFVFDKDTHKAFDVKVIGTRDSYPNGPAKKTTLIDCAFTSGIVMREDGKSDLYSGIGDTEAARIVIDYPFAGYGKILEFK